MFSKNKMFDIKGDLKVSSPESLVHHELAFALSVRGEVNLPAEGRPKKSKLLLWLHQ